MKVLALTTAVGCAAVAAIAFRPTIKSAPSPSVAKETPFSSDGGVVTHIASRNKGRPKETQIGDWVRYSANLRFGAEMKSDGDGEKKRLDLAVKGLWRATLAEETDDLSTYEIVLESPTVRLPQTDFRMQRGIEEMLSVPHYITVDSSGRLRGLQTASETEPTTWRMWFQLASAVQHALPRKASSGQTYYDVEELDAAGEYVAEYKRTAPSRYEKRKLHYLRVRSGDVWDERNANSLGIDSLLTVYGRPGQFAQRVNGKEVTWTEDDLAMIGLRVTTEISMERTDSGRDPQVAQRLSGKRGQLVVSDFAPQIDNADAAPAESFAELKNLLSDPSNDASLYLHRFVSSFRTDPAAIAEAVQWIRGDEDADPTALIAAALGEAGTPAAEAALIELTGDEVSERYAQEAILELGRVKEPSAAAVATLMKASEDERRGRADTAVLALGNAADSLFRVRKKSAGDIMKSLVERLRNAESEGEISTLLAALGNTASQDALPVISEYLSASSPSLRGAAADALRSIPGEESVRLLSEVLSTDEQATVRGQAASALGYHPRNLALAPLSLAAKEDAVALVRGEVVNSLGNIGRHDEEVRRVLAYVSRHDDDENVRRVAEALL